VIKISVQADISGALRKLKLAQSQVKYATAVALTRTAKVVEAELQREITKSFNNPTPFTQRALRTQPATKARLTARVFVKDYASKGNAASKWLLPGVEGGQRNTKGFERLLQRAGVMPSGWYAMPTKYIARDAYGNVPAGVVVKILSQLQASRDPSVNEKSAAKKKRNRKMRAGRYFAIQPGRSHLPPGIYERVSFAFGAAVKPMFIYTSKRPTYKRRFKFYERGQDLAKREFPGQFELAARMAMATAR
jgi:hypothetical protein